jgi:predicted N-formylglutamate amidohydrolase
MEPNLADSYSGWELAPGEPPVASITNRQSNAPYVVIADHAGRAVPAALDQLGLPDAALDQHIAYDIGARELAIAIGAALGAPVVLANYSRLVIDVNRREHSSTLIPAVSDGLTIPGNAALAEAQINARKQLLLWPYHQAVAALLSEREANELFNCVISVHSFTPAMDGCARPWDIGVLWDRDGGMAAPLIKHLRARGDLVVGDNEPYSARGIEGYTMAAHAESRELPNALFEVRQDLLGTAANIDRWSTIVCDAISALGDIRQLQAPNPS